VNAFALWGTQQSHAQLGAPLIRTTAVGTSVSNPGGHCDNLNRWHHQLQGYQIRCDL
jgi:hypothetical protein